MKGGIKFKDITDWVTFYIWFIQLLVMIEYLFKDTFKAIPTRWRNFIFLALLFIAGVLVGYYTR